MATLLPPIRWAQRKDRLFLTIELRDIKDEKVDWVSPSQLKFSCTSNNKSYHIDLELFGEVNIEESKWNVTGFNGQFILIKKDKGAFWKRLTKDDKKSNHISVDWSKWVDEDEEEDEANKGLGMDWNPDNMRGFNDQGEEDSDDDGDNLNDEENKLDDLEKDEEITPPTKADNKESDEKIDEEIKS